MTDLAPIVLSNGSLKDPKTGQFLPGIRPTSAISSTERARELAGLRQQKAAQHARKALVEAVAAAGYDARGPAQATGLIAGEFARSALANAMDKPRDAVSAAKFALRVADMLPDERAGLGPGVAMRIEFGEKALEFLAELAKR